MREWSDDHGTSTTVLVRCNGNNCGHEFYTEMITQYGARSLRQEWCPDCHGEDLTIERSREACR